MEGVGRMSGSGLLLLLTDVSEIVLIRVLSKTDGIVLLGM